MCPKREARLDAGPPRLGIRDYRDDLRRVS